MVDVDVTVIGAGVVGLSISYAFSKAGFTVLLIEKEKDVGCGVSSRSNEVIHAGVYYKSGSLKGELCLRGKGLLYEFCEKYGVEHKKIGKLFLAISQKEIPILDRIATQGKANGLDDLVFLDRKGLKRIEPALQGEAALYSPTTGIIDSYQFIHTLLGLAEKEGTIVARCSPVEGAEPTSDGWKVRVGGDDPTIVTSRVVINSAGLYSLLISRLVFPERDLPSSNPVKGTYFRYSGRSPIEHIVFPAQAPGIIEERINATPSTAGILRFGASIEEADGIEDFKFNLESVEKFRCGIKSYLPDLDFSRVHLDQLGIRPKISTAGGGIPDFTFEWAPESGWLDLWGIESPGLTASLAIGDYVYNFVMNEGMI